MTVADAVLYGTIWMAIALFVAGQAGQRELLLHRGGGSLALWWLWLAGALLCFVHMAMSLGLRHGWSHEDALRATALQTQAVYGVRWSGGLYVNYLFASVWLAEAIWWRAAPGSFVRRSTITVWLIRVFYLVIILNAAIVFAAPSRRIAGGLVVAALLWTWRPHRDGPENQPTVSSWQRRTRRSP